VVERQLLPQPVFTLAQRADPSPDCGHMLPDGKVDPLHKGCVDVPPQWGEDVIDSLQGAKHHAALHIAPAPAPYGLDHLRIEQLRQRHPTRFGGWPCGLAVWHLDPVAKMGHDGGEVFFIAITEKQWYAVRSQQDGHLVEDALRHGQGPLTEVDGQEEFTLGLHGDPDPMRGARQALDRLILADFALFESTEHGIEFVELHLAHMDVTEKIG
jgi:hypothetical protein